MLNEERARCGLMLILSGPCGAGKTKIDQVREQAANVE
jgi:tRNA A37 threonylcarbamoyladenosine biosynthesis protein TsaE